MPRKKCDINQPLEEITVTNMWFSSHPSHMRWYVTLSNGMRIAAARWLMWLKTGTLPHGKNCVHHIDGNRLNDYPDNLVVITISNHNVIHNKGNRVGAIPKTIEHKKRIGQGNFRYDYQTIKRIILEKPNITARELAKALGAHSHGFISYRFGSFSALKNAILEGGDANDHALCLQN